MDAYVLVRNTASHVDTWNDDYERLVGSLLGYSDAANDAWHARNRRLGFRWRFFTRYFRPSWEEVRILNEIGIKGLVRNCGRDFKFCGSQIGLAPIRERLRVKDPATESPDLVRFWCHSRYIGRFKELHDKTADDQFGFFIIPQENLKEFSDFIDHEFVFVPDDDQNPEK